MQWSDRVYGETKVDDPRIERLINCSTFQRLKGVRQAGPSALAFSFKMVSRFEHSLGVYTLLGRVGASEREQVAGLLHDLSHTAFSHAADFLYSSEEQDFHETLKPIFLARDDVQEALAELGYEPEMFYDDSIYPILERPLPMLCADRLDYFLRDSLACGVTKPEQSRRILDHVRVESGILVFDDINAAKLAASLYSTMNRDWWASPTEGFIYNEFADVLRHAQAEGILSRDDLLEDDATVLAILEAARHETIDHTLDRIRRFDPAMLEGYVPRTSPKRRRLDPEVMVGNRVMRLSQVDKSN